MWCLCVGVLIVCLFLLGVRDCVYLLIVRGGGYDMMGDVVLVTWFVEWCCVLLGCVRL